MDLSWTVPFVVIAQWAPSIILVVACVSYARRVRSRLTYALAVGVSGGLLVAVASTLFTAFGMPLMYSPDGFSQTASVILGVLNLAGFAFALLFAISLFRVLRGLSG